MGTKAGRAGGQPGVRPGRDQIPRRSSLTLRAPPTPPPSLSMRQLTPVREACFSFAAARPSPSPLLPSPPPPHARFSPPPLISAAPEGLCARGSSLRLLRGLGSPHARGTAWVRKDHRRLKKWVGDGLALFPACCQPQSPTGSRRHVADVREDKGRHGPHQPPVIDGLCPRAHARAAELGDCGGLL